MKLRCEDVDLRSSIERHANELGHIEVWPSLKQAKDVLLHQRLQATLCESVADRTIKLRNFLAYSYFIEGDHHAEVFQFREQQGLVDPLQLSTRLKAHVILLHVFVYLHRVVDAVEVDRCLGSLLMEYPLDRLHSNGAEARVDIETHLKALNTVSYFQLAAHHLLQVFPKLRLEAPQLFTLGEESEVFRRYLMMRYDDLIVSATHL